MKFTRRLLTGIVVGVLAVGVTGCGAGNTENAKNESTSASSKNTESTSDSLKEVVIGVPQTNDALGMELGNVAVKEGFLEEELNAVGYTANVQGFVGAGPEINEAFVAGSVDIAVYGDFPTITCKSNGMDTVVIGATNHLQQYGVLAGKDSGIKEAKDLEGKTAGVMQGTAAQYSWEKYIEQKGLEKVEVVNASPTDTISMLQSGDIDVFPTALYNANFFAAQGAGTLIDTSIENPESGTQFLVVADRSFISENEAVGVAIEKALIRSQEYAIENPDALYEALASETYSADIMKTGYDFDETFDYLSPDMSEEDIEKLQAVIDFMKEKGIISETLDAASIVDNSYYEKAVEELKK